MKGTILLAVDHSKVAERAADIVAGLSAAEGNDVVVLHVHQVATGRWGEIVIEREPAGGRIAEQISEDLRKSVALKSAGSAVSAVSAGVAVGHVGAEIARVAERVDAALIVMGTHSESDVASIVLGSTSHRVLHLAHRPTLLVPAG